MPTGFQAAGIKAGLKTSGKLDLALVLAPEGAVCAGTFTRSLMRAACVDICTERLQSSSGHCRAVLINSGQANACTGEYGLIDTLKATQVLADLLGLNVEEVLMCSTGVIGVPIEMDRLLQGLEVLVKELNTQGGSLAAEAILTTDLVQKECALEADLGGRRVRLGGMAKGSGMIHPDMATMLGYLSCDVGVPAEVWLPMIQRSVDSSFNAITVDGDTSTNDLFLGFAAGEPLGSDYWDALETGVKSVTQNLAKAIARDGEGATCLLEVEVEGVECEEEARLIARTICGSALVKTAVHGCDPNWGRIVAAAGRAGVSFNPEDLELWIGPFQLIKGGKPLAFSQLAVSRFIKDRIDSPYLDGDTVPIRLIVGSGHGSAIAWGCDLSDEYVRINADYTT